MRAALLLGALLLLAMARVEGAAAEVGGRPLPRSVMAPVIVMAEPLASDRVVIIQGREYLIDLRAWRRPFERFFARQ